MLQMRRSSFRNESEGVGGGGGVWSFGVDMRGESLQK